MVRRRNNDYCFVNVYEQQVKTVEEQKQLFRDKHLSTIDCLLIPRGNRKAIQKVQQDGGDF